MADEPLTDTKGITPSARAENEDAQHIERRDTATRDPKATEDVKADAAIEDRFEATDN